MQATVLTLKKFKLEIFEIYKVIQNIHNMIM